MRWLAFALLGILFSCSSRTNNLKIKGSDTEVNLAVLLAEAFHSEQPELFVSVSGGGSGLGIASLLNRNADIANSSRALKQEEFALFDRRQFVLDSFIFAQDAIAFVVSDVMPIDSISTKEIAKILSGESTNWSELTGKDMPINIYGRQSNSGTYEYVKTILDIHFCPHAKQMNGNAQILEALKSDVSGFGYVSAGYVMESQLNGIKVLNIYSDQSEAISPLNAEKIASGEYFFQRPLFQYYKKSDYARIKPFLDFEQSEEGKKIIQLSGYYPVHE